MRLIRYFLITLLSSTILSTCLHAASYDTALKFFYKGQYQAALNELDTTNDGSPDRSSLLRSFIYLKLNSPEQALETFEKVDLTSLKLGEYEPFVRVQFLLASKPSIASLNNALAYLERHEQGPLLQKSLLDAAIYLIHIQQLDKADSLLSKVITLQPKSSYSERALGLKIQQALLSQNTELAKNLYTKLLIQFPLSTTQKELFLKLQSALNVSTLTTVEFIDSPSTQLELFRTFYAADRYELAKEFGLKLLQSNSLSSSVLAELETHVGLSYFLLHDYGPAIVHLNKAVQLSSESEEWGAKASFYIARSHHLLKQFDEAKTLYRNLVSNKTYANYADESMYYLYWIYLDEGKLNDYVELLKQVRKKGYKSQYLDKIVWELAWQEYQKGNSAKAFEWLKSQPWVLNSADFKAKMLFWTGKMIEPINPKKAKFYYSKCLVRYPYTFYSYRITNGHFPKQISGLPKAIKPLGLVPDKNLLRLSSLGLGEWVAQDLAWKIQHDFDSNKMYWVYTLASIYTQIGQYYPAIATLEKYGYGFKPIKGYIPQEFAQILYPRAHWDAVQKWAKAFDVDPYLSLALMREESMFKAEAVSRSGALGLMQIMPATGQGIASVQKVTWEGKTTLLNPDYNIQFGIWYISNLKKRFNNEYAHMLSGYNAGPNITRKWVNKATHQDLDQFIAEIPYSETNYYVTRVLKTYWIYKNLYE